MRRAFAVAVVLWSMSAFAADPERDAKCKGSGLTIYRAEKAGESVVYRFCDGAKLLKRPDGGVSLSMPLGGPEYDAFTENARANLEVADHNASVLGTQTARNRAASARAAFEARVQQFMAKRPAKDRYIAAAKKCSLAVE